MKIKIYLFILVFGILLMVFGTDVVNAEGNLQFIHQNHLGSISVVTNQSGRVISKEVNFPYGSTRTESGDSPTERGYSGQISDTEQTGLYYYNARYYNPLISKFTQADTIGDGLNRYAYVGSNPIIFTDPTGHQSCDMSDYICRHMDELVAGGGSNGGGFWSGWESTLSSYNTYVDIETTSPTAVKGKLAVGGLSLIPFGIACATNPICAGIAAKAATVVDVVDTIVDTVMCVNGDLDACFYVTNPIPGMSLMDNLPNPKYGESAFVVGSDEIYLERGRILNNRVDDWIEQAAKTEPSDELEFLTELNGVIYKDVVYDLPLVNKVRSLAPNHPKTKSRSIAFYALCRRGVCSQKAQFLHAASRKAGYNTDLFYVGNVEDGHLLVRHQIGDKFYFLDPTWDFVTEGFAAAQDTWRRGGFDIGRTGILNRPE
jgi:RHS repeat-associated protein